MKEVYQWRSGLSPGNIYASLASSSDYILTLPDINSCVGCTDRENLFNENVLAFDRIDFASTIRGLGTTGPFDTKISKRNMACPQNLHSISNSILHREILDDEGIAGRNDSGAAGSL